MKFALTDCGPVIEMVVVDDVGDLTKPVQFANTKPGFGEADRVTSVFAPKEPPLIGDVVPPAAGLDDVDS